MEEPIKVFISYSWDSEDHKTWVRNLSARLRQDGVDAQIDQYNSLLARDLRHYMEEKLREADKVILIFTPKYKTKVDAREGASSYEYGIILTEWTEDKSKMKKFIPVLRDGEPTDAIPIFARSFIYSDMREGQDIEKGYEFLLRTIYESPEYEAPPIGNTPDFIKKKIAATPQFDTSISQQITESQEAHQQKKASTELKHRLKEMLPDNQFQSVIEQIIQYTKERNQATLNDQALQLQRQYNSWQEYQMLGLFSNSEESLTINKITRSLFQLIDRM
ncbi:MAG: TIR domain-containing protein [Bacteroidota bacterium]